MCFFLTYRAVKVAGIYRPGRRRMGFDLWLGGAMPSGFSHKQIDACRASFALSKHCFCHYNGAWLAFVSFTLSKHRFCNDKPFCTSVHHSQQALLLDAQNRLARCPSVLASIAFGYPKAARPPVRHSLRGEYPQTPLVFHISFTSKGEQQ